MRLDCITTSVADTLKLHGTGSNQNCALRTLRRILSLAQEFVIIQAPRNQTPQRKQANSSVGRQNGGEAAKGSGATA